MAKVLALLFVMLAPPARAFYGQPYITPSAPIAGEDVSFNIPMGVCDVFAQRQGFPQITHTGNNIAFRQFGFHDEDGDELCTFPTGAYFKSIGAFHSGSYTFTLEMAYYDRFGVPTILNMGTIPFTVSPPPAAVSVPTGNAGIPALSMAIIAAAALGLRRRKSCASSSGRFSQAQPLATVGAASAAMLLRMPLFPVRRHTATGTMQW